MGARAAVEPGARVVFGVATVVSVLDWTAKALATTELDDAPVELGSLITLRLSHNPGIAFGLGDRLPGPVLIAATAAVSAVLAVAAVRGLLGSRLASGLLLGGAIANLVDRMVGGTVVDFLDLGWWPSFNVADVALTTGVALILLTSLRQPTSEPAP